MFYPPNFKRLLQKRNRVGQKLVSRSTLHLQSLTHSARLRTLHLEAHHLYQKARLRRLLTQVTRPLSLLCLVQADLPVALEQVSHLVLDHSIHIVCQGKQ